MASKDLSEEDLDNWESRVRNYGGDAGALQAIAEIRRRRAADLTEEEREALRLLRRHMPMWFREDSDERGTYENRARAVLDRLLAGGGGR